MIHDINIVNLLNKTLYHGSINKYDILKPLGVDFGNIFQKPGWSLFCWDNYRNAERWAVLTFSVCSNEINTIIKKYGNEKIEYRFIDDNNGIIMTKESLNNIDKYILKKKNTYIYVYEFDYPVYKIGVGNTKHLDEYTIRDNIKDFKLHKIKVTKELITKYVKIVDKIDYDKKYDIKYMRYGKISKMIYNREFIDNMDIYDKLRIDMDNGKLKPGDKLNKYIK